MRNTPESLGNNIRNWLKVKGMKQETLARKMNVEPSYISQLLCGKPEILEKRKLEIAKHLEVDPEQLDTNPMQVFNFSNGNADRGSNINSVQNVYQIDAELVSQLKEILPSLNELVKKIDERNR